MFAQLKIHSNKWIAISLMMALLFCQFISVHTHLAEEQHHHGIHVHNVESHNHGWLGHYSAELSTNQLSDNQVVDIEPTGSLSKLQQLKKHTFDFDAILPQQSIGLSSIQTSIVINAAIVTGPVDNYHISRQPRAPPVSS